MQKNVSSFCALGLFISFAVVSCGAHDSNTNMTVQSSTAYSEKWNAFADFVGLQHLEDMPDLADRHAVEKSLSTPPSNFQFNGKNQIQYGSVMKTVQKYILSQEPNMHAVQVLSIEPYEQVLSASDFSAQRSSSMSIPYVQRDGTVADLSGIKTFSSLDGASLFKIYPTEHGQVIQDDTKAVRGHVYLMTYKTGGQSGNQVYRALISIPEDASATKQYPLMVFAHGGDAGSSFKEVAMLLQENLGKFIVAAPVYPGEPLCSGNLFQGDRTNAYTRTCLDASGNPTGPSIAPIGIKSPTRDDVNGLLALVDGISKLASGNSTTEFYDGNNVFYDNQAADSLIPFNDPDKAFGVKTIGVADSRGGATLYAAVGRAGFIFAAKKTGEAPAYFSGLALFGAPSSFLVGQFRFLLQNFFNGVVPDNLRALPMVPEFMDYFKGYRDAELGSKQERAELENLVGWISSSDITFLAPYVGVGLKNWTALWSGNSAPASVALFHGTQDKVVPFTESVIAKNAFDSLFANVYGPSESKDLFDASVIPPGSQLFSFQSDVSYVSDPKSSYHVMDPSFMTGHLINQSMQNDAQRSDMKGILLFGGNNSSSSTHESVSQQFDFFNNAFQSNDLQQRRPYVLSPDCSVLKNGSCAIYNQDWSSSSRPLYNRTILQDVTHGVPSPMYSAAWDPSAQNSVLTPADVFSAWVDFDVLGELGVLQHF